MPLEILPPAIRFKRAGRVGTAIRSQRLMRAFMFGQITRVRTREVAEAALMGFLALVKC
jgi:hypothetical protein